MALTRVVYTQQTEGNGTFTVPFPYLDADDVKVTVDGVSTAVTWNSPSVLNISPAPAVGAIVYIQRRTTSDELLVDFTDGSTLTERQLDLMAQQNFYLAQEAFDRTEDSIADNGKFELDAKDRRIINVANAVEGGDAVNKRTLQYEYPAVLTVAESIGNVNVVGGDLSSVSLYQMDLGSVADAPTVSTEGATSTIRAVAEIKQSVQTVALSASQVRTVGDNIDAVIALAPQATAVGNINTNLSEILEADTNATTATTKAGEAAASAAAAASYASTASTKATESSLWAVKMDGAVAGGEYSAKYWAAMAAEAAENMITGVAGVASFNGRSGNVSLTSTDVTDALGYTPFYLDNSLDMGTLT